MRHMKLIGLSLLCLASVSGSPAIAVGSQDCTGISNSSGTYQACIRPCRRTSSGECQCPE